MNIFRRETSTTDVIERIKNDVITCETNNNDDMNISLKGYMHNNTGFVLTVNNIEKLDDTVLKRWKNVVEKHGYVCDMRYDFHDGWVDLRCTASGRSKPFLKVHNFQQIVYLSMIVFSIYMLWQRHNKMPQK